MQNDGELDVIVEKFLTQRIHAPRVELSNDFNMALGNEIRRLHKQGINAKRILAAIDFTTQSIVNDKTLKQDQEWQKKLEVPQKPEEKPAGLPPKLTPEDFAKAPKYMAGGE